MFGLSLGLSSVAFKLIAVLIASIVIFGGGWVAWGVADQRGFDRAVAQYQAAGLEIALAEANKQLADLKAVIAADDERRERDAIEITSLREQVNATPPNDTVCLDADTAARINRVR